MSRQRRRLVKTERYRRPVQRIGYIRSAKLNSRRVAAAIVRLGAAAVNGA